MQKLQFSIDIKSPKERVWNVLWEDKTYREWTGVFHEGSYAVTDGWKEGSKVQFLTPEGNGMYSKVAKNIPEQFMSFQHLGEIKNGIEQPDEEKTKAWSEGRENYILVENGGTTTLTAEMDAPEEFQDYFKTTFPKALDKVKEISENGVAKDE